MLSENDIQIDLCQPHDVIYWSAKYNITPWQLKKAIDVTKSSYATIVETYLQRKGLFSSAYSHI